MRLSKQKTPLARLRTMLKTNEGRLSQKNIGAWLGLSHWLVQKIETGDKPLTPSNADKIVLQTGVSAAWLQSGDASRPPVDGFGKRYTQATFDARQKELQKGGRVFEHDARRARRCLTENFAKLAAIMLRAFERGELEQYDFKVRKALSKIFFDEGEDRAAWLDLVILAQHGKPSLTRPDVAPIVNEWETRVRRVLASRGRAG